MSHNDLLVNGKIERRRKPEQCRVGSITDPLPNDQSFSWKAAMEYDYERFLIELGTRVKGLRKERGLSHRRMVAEFGFHLGQLAKIEKGGAVSAQTLLKLCAAFDMTLEDLVRGIGQQPQS